MPSREQGWTKQMEKNADVFTRTKPQVEALAPWEGIRRLPEDEEEPKPKRLPELPLKKSGEHMDVGDARLWEEELRKISETHPAQLRALHSLVEGRAEEVTEQQFQELRALGVLTPKGLPRPGLIPVMKAAYRETPDGPCIVDPLDVRTPEDAATLQRAEEQMEEMRKEGIERLRRRLFGEDQGEDKGRAR